MSQGLCLHRVSVTLRGSRKKRQSVAPRPETGSAKALAASSESRTAITSRNAAWRQDQHRPKPAACSPTRAPPARGFLLPRFPLRAPGKPGQLWGDDHQASTQVQEGLCAEDRTPADSTLAIFGIKAFREALPQVYKAPDDLAAREATQRAAWACGTVLASVGMALHHKLCHTLGGSFDLPRAETHEIILPHAVAYNMVAVPELLEPVSELFGCKDPALGLWEFARSLDAPRSLAEFDLQETDLGCGSDNPQPLFKPAFGDPPRNSRPSAARLERRDSSAVNPA